MRFSGSQHRNATDTCTVCEQTRQTCVGSSSSSSQKNRSPSLDSNLEIPTLGSIAHCHDDLRKGALNSWPARGGEDYDGDGSCVKVLLILEVSVGGDKHLEMR